MLGKSLGVFFSLSVGVSCLFGSEVKQFQFKALSKLLVLSRGRLKPLLTHAKELVQQGKLPEGHALSNCVISLLDPEKILSAAYLVPKEEEKSVFGSKPISPREVLDFWDRELERFHASQEADEAKRRQSQNHLMAIWKKIYRIYSVSRDIEEGNHVPFIADPSSNEGRFVGWKEAQKLAESGHQGVKEILQAFLSVKEAYLRGDQRSFSSNSSKLISVQRKVLQKLSSQLEKAGLRVPSPSLVKVELLYVALDVRVPALILFILASIAFALSFCVRRPLLKSASLAFLCLAIAWNLWIIGARTAIGARLPLKNLNEVFLVVLFFVPLIGAFISLLMKNKTFVLAACVLTSIGYVGSFMLPRDGYVITPLVAILQSHWREIHVLTIMFSYAVMLVAAGLHTAFLFVRTRPETADHLFNAAYHILAWGFLFLTLGICTGAAWANASWGRYWGWDPKEVWALIAWSIYAVFLHVRIFFKVRREVLAVISLMGFAAILFTYFGVSYLLPGLHSYA